MGKFIVFCFTFFMFFPSVMAQENHSDRLSGWESLNRSAQAEVLNDLDYLGSESLPMGTSIVSYAEQGSNFDPSKIANVDHKLYIEKIIATFDREVSREDIEQSPFSAYGEEEITGLYLLVNGEGEILGSLMRKYQDGRDEDGEAGDINWSASVRFDPAGEVFVNETGSPYDDLYFEWSGH